MIKLVRNTLSDKLILRYEDDIISWQDIIAVQEIQESEGLNTGTELKKKHILYNNSKMNVSLAAQTLSDGVNAALKFCSKHFPDKFQNAEETSKFCSTMNDAFNILNVRSKFAKKKKYNLPLNDDNFNELKSRADEIIEYISLLFTEIQRMYLFSKVKKRLVF